MMNSPNTLAHSVALLMLLSSAGCYASDYPHIKLLGWDVRDISDDGRYAAVITLPHGLPARWEAPDLFEPIDIAPALTVGLARISPDGSTVVGVGTGENWWNVSSFHWTAAAGSTQFGGEDTQTGSTSTDGSVIVGAGRPAPGQFHQAFRWTQQGGFEFLPAPPNSIGGAGGSVSADGSVVGVVAYLPDPPQCWRWVHGTGYEFITPPPGYDSCWPAEVSPDGQLMLAQAYSPDDAIGLPFLWSPSTGPTLLPFPWQQHPGSGASSMNADGSVIVGTGSGQGVIWTPEGEFFLRSYLSSRGINLNNWGTLRPRMINPAGDVIAGRGIYLGNWRGFIAYLSGCYANCDGSSVEPVLNVEDFMCFINRYAEAATLPHEDQLVHYANCDHSTAAPVINVDDFICFINKFIAGCD
jgi:hypothetical protein